jgi:hypothetical protein
MAYVREYPNKIRTKKWYSNWYLHFRILELLEFPLIPGFTVDARI